MLMTGCLKTLLIEEEFTIGLEKKILTMPLTPCRAVQGEELSDRFFLVPWNSKIVNVAFNMDPPFNPVF